MYVIKPAVIDRNSKPGRRLPAFSGWQVQAVERDRERRALSGRFKAWLRATVAAR
jgi:hypothetical protein